MIHLRMSGCLNRVELASVCNVGNADRRRHQRPPCSQVNQLLALMGLKKSAWAAQPIDASNRSTS